MRTIYIMILLATLGVVGMVGCGKEDDCESQIKIRFENQTDVVFTNLRLIPEEGDNIEIGHLEINEISDYVNINTKYERLVAEIENNPNVGTRIDISNEKGCYSYILTEIDTMNVFIPTTLWYQIIKE